MRCRELALAAVAAATLGLTGCSGSGENLGEATDTAAEVVPVKGSDQGKVVLTQDAFDRLAIATSPVTDGVGRGTSAPAVRSAIPSAAVLYDAEGATWAYASVGTRTYQRVPLAVERFRGGTAYLSDGPKPGTLVVTVGAPELMGVELGVEGE